MIEIGGFPGILAGYLKKKFDYDTTILDYVIYPNIIRKVENVYSLKMGSIKAIKSDFLTYNSVKKYDVVISSGFVEHFENWRDILKRHYNLLSENGLLLVTMPNFLGINGYCQKLFDENNFKKHNLKAMNIKEIQIFLNTKKYTNSLVRYIGKPTLWLEPDAPVNQLTKTIINYLRKVLKRIPFKNNKLLAPYILIIALKNQQEVQLK